MPLFMQYVHKLYFLYQNGKTGFDCYKSVKWVLIDIACQFYKKPLYQFRLTTSEVST